uniref:Putative secreted protein n=1 Tax=Ixodes ricinus TaxID=34613 RepID=A0A6B0V4B2_IXORI
MCLRKTAGSSDSNAHFAHVRALLLLFGAAFLVCPASGCSCSSADMLFWLLFWLLLLAFFLGLYVLVTACRFASLAKRTASSSITSSLSWSSPSSSSSSSITSSFLTPIEFGAPAAAPSDDATTATAKPRSSATSEDGSCDPGCSFSRCAMRSARVGWSESHAVHLKRERPHRSRWFPTWEVSSSEEAKTASHSGHLRMSQQVERSFGCTDLRCWWKLSRLTKAIGHAWHLCRALLCVSTICAASSF